MQYDGIVNKTCWVGVVLKIRADRFRLDEACTVLLPYQKHLLCRYVLVENL